MNIFGFIACIAITLAYIPQCISIYKTGNTNGLNPKTFFIINLGMVLWIIHSIIIKDIPLFLSSIASLLQNSYILYKILKNK